MKQFYTPNTRLFWAGTFVLCALASCQQKSADNKGSLSAPAAMGQSIDQRFSQNIAEYHNLPEVESVDLRNVQTALDGTTKMEVQKILAQLPNNSKKNNVSPKDTKSNKDSSQMAPLSLSSQTADSLAEIDNPIVQNAALLLGVRSYEEGYKTVQSLSSKYSAEIISEEEHSSDSLLENTFVMLTPPQHFEAVVNELREMAMIIRQKRIWRKDLTAQFVDLKTRITAKQEAQIRLNGLLSNSKNMEEVLPVQRELDAITTELESLVRTTRALSEKAVFTTITVTIYQNLDRPVAQADFGDRFSGGISKGWVDFKDFLINATLVWPWIGLGLIFFLTIWLAIRTSRRQTRQFQLQSMQQQQQWLIQQQKFATNTTATPNAQVQPTK